MERIENSGYQTALSIKNVYALEFLGLNGMDENLFVSKYMLQLPDKEQLERFLIREMKEMGI